MLARFPQVDKALLVLTNEDELKLDCFSFTHVRCKLLKDNCIQEINVVFFFNIASFVIQTGRGFQHFTAAKLVCSCSDVLLQF